MSYILDALKQSDNQRKDTEAAGVMPHVEVDSERENRRAFRGGSLLALLGVAVFFAWFLSGKDSSTAVEQIDVAAEPQDLVVKPIDTADVKVSPETDSISKEELYGVIIDVSDPSAAAEVKQDQPDRGKQTVEVVSQSPGPVNKTSPSDTSKVDISPVSPAVSANTVNSAVKNTLAVTGSAQQKMATAASRGEEETLYWRQLPLDVQRSMPKLQFSVHVYAAEPSARMVKVNGRVLREGARITANIRLVEITKTGVVLIYREHRFRMNAV